MQGKALNNKTYQYHNLSNLFKHKIRNIEIKGYQEENIN